MQIQLNDADLREAVRSYMLKLNIGTPITDIEFSTTRSGGTKIHALVRLADIDQPQAPQEDDPISAVSDSSLDTLIPSTEINDPTSYEAESTETSTGLFES